MYNFLDSIGVYEKEQCMYEFILPEINQHLDHQISPHIYPSPIEKILILQDLSYFGYYTRDYRKQLTLEESKIALQTLAKFHAASYKLQLGQHKSLTKVYNELLYSEDLVTRTVKIWLPIISILLQKENFPLQQIQQLTSMKDEIIKNFLFVINSHVTKFNVLNHGDFRTTNILFKYNDLGEPIDVKLIDFQICRLCSPVFDIIYFMMSSIPFVIFVKNSEELYDAYLETLNNTLSKLNCQRHYRKIELKNDLVHMKSIYLFVFCLLNIIFGNSNCVRFNLMHIKGEEEMDKVYDFDIVEEVCNDKIFIEKLCEWFKYFVSNGYI
ncbi:hypothetical protein PGB90_007297 [Kerria lacca]